VEAYSAAKNNLNKHTHGAPIYKGLSCCDLFVCDAISKGAKYHYCNNAKKLVLSNHERKDCKGCPDSAHGKMNKKELVDSRRLLAATVIDEQMQVFEDGDFGKIILLVVSFCMIV